MHWHVDDLDATVAATAVDGRHGVRADHAARSAGFVTASVVDPFGNVLGVMYNPHYLEVLASTKPA